MRPDHHPDRDLSRRRARILLALVLIGCFALYCFPLWWGLPSRDGWAFDEIRPYQVQEAELWLAKYPPLHRYVLKTVFWPLDALQSSGIVALRADELYHAKFVASRLLSVLLAVATVYLVYRCGRLLADRGTALLAAVVAALLCPQVYYAKIANLDAPFLFWFTLSLFFYLKILRAHRLRDYLAWATCAVFAVATKDYGYGLYLPVPLLFAVGLSARTSGGRPTFRGAVRALADRRMLAAGALVVVWFLLIYQVISGTELLGAHLYDLTSREIVGQYQEFPWTVAGQIGLLVQSARNTWFTLGAPSALLALLGLALTFRTWRRDLVPLSFLLLAASYYVAFLCVIGFTIDRYFLPVGILLSFFAARGAMALLRARRLPRPAAWALLGLGLLHTLLRGVSVDLLMAGDSRYQAERWLAAHASGGAVLGVGDAEMVPRGVHRVSLADIRDEGCAVLEELDAELVAMYVDETRADELGTQVAGRLRTGLLGYAEEIRFGNRAPLDLLDVRGVNTNLDKLGREALVFRRLGGGCLDDRTIGGELSDLRHQPDPGRRQHLLDRILAATPSPGPRVRDWILINLLEHDWTPGTDPSAVIVRNPRQRPYRPRLRLALGPASAPRLPIRVFIEDGQRVRTHTLEQTGSVSVRLSVIAPESSRLYIVWTDKDWVPGGLDQRRLGVRLVPPPGRR